MRLSLSKKEVAEIHLMLTTLPIPPIPVIVDMDVTKLEDGELKTAFEMATSSIVKDSQLHDGIVNAHSIFAALSFFVKWSAAPTPEGAARQVDMQHKKDASLLRIITSILDFNGRENFDTHTASRDDDILQIFVVASQEWVNTYLPDTITIAIKAAPKNKTIGYEHDMHIAMAHYCYAQGVLYNSKDSRLMCTVHDGLYNTYLQMVKLAAEDVEPDDSGKPEDNSEHIEIAKMYSQFPYHKMLLLCYDRLLRDCLYGHTLDVPGNDVEQNARDLLKVSYENYKSIVNKSVTAEAQCSRIVEVPLDETVTPTPAPVEMPSPPVLQRNTPRVLAVGKTGCMADMGSYKSSMGMFVLGIVNFLLNNDAYSVSNMRTSLRHLQELAYTGSDMAKQACSLINMPALVQLVRTHMLGIECGRDMQEEIEMSLLELETLVPTVQTSVPDEFPFSVTENTPTVATDTAVSSDTATSTDTATAADTTEAAANTDTPKTSVIASNTDPDDNNDTAPVSGIIATLAVTDTAPVSATVGTTNTTDTAPVSAPVSVTVATTDTTDTVPVSATVATTDTVPVSATVATTDTVPVSATVATTDTVPVSATVATTDTVPVSATVATTDTVPVSATVATVATVATTDTVPVSATVATTDTTDAAPVSATVAPTDTTDTAPVSATVGTTDTTDTTVTCASDTILTTNTIVNGVHIQAASNNAKASE